MAHPVTAAATIPVPRIESRQARLDAAIALFRSEASASGYVVEEVRLRLPVPDVDVMPRVVIAQQNASSGPPPTFPRAKHHRPMPSYPLQPPVIPEQAPKSPRDGVLVSPRGGGHVAPTLVPSEQTRSAAYKSGGGGFKRTVSGSVIFHSVPARTTSVQRESKQNGHQHKNSSQRMAPLSSIPYAPTKDGRPSLPPNAQNNGQFWKTVIGGERGKQILQAAENMQRLKHATVEQGKANNENRVNPAPMDVNKPMQSVSERGERVAKNGEDQKRKDNDAKLKERSPKKENTHHINGHDIPESHVQLLLSSAADISARERKSSSKPEDVSFARPFEKGKKLRPQAVVGGKPSGTKATSVSSGKHYSRGRRDGERRTSGSSAARPYKCTKCPSSFDREGHLRVHILAVHEKKRPFVCQVCDASFGHSSSLLRHVRTVHQASPAIGSGRTNNGSRNAPNSNDSNSTKSELVCEEFQDDSEKHFRCSACAKAFNRVALLNRHVAEKHPLQTSMSDDENKGSP